MGKGCLTATKYFLFLFNLIFFLCGAVIMGFGLWLLLDNQSFIVVLNNLTTVKVACYILIGVGAFSMLMGFLGCLGAVYEIRCLLGLYFTCLLVILIAQITAGALIYFQKDVLHEETSKIVTKVLDNYTGNNSTTEQTWDFIQRNVRRQGCADSVERWILTNIGVVLGICLGVAVVELLGMILSICLCKNIHTEDYTKVPKY
ncbi:CD82 antigen-like [Morone saxatilis]|uniref:CD82 antigen-like n=1 Tax=Morone saxatilis TaxID=34816 RepID=UPI0015E23AD4|nr:CD82 antigen-like [Morone saxatilis]